MSRLQEIANMATDFTNNLETNSATEPLPESSPQQPEDIKAQIENLTEDIKATIKKQVVDETKPFFLAVHSATTELRQITESVRSNARGLKHYLFVALIACVAGTASFFLLKMQLGLGVDADYGRKARAVIQQLDSKNKAILEQLIERK
jgi:hypothetical protein